MKMFTIKDNVTNNYIGAIIINNCLFFHKKPSVYASRRTIEKLMIKLIQKYPVLKDRLIIKEDDE